MKKVINLKILGVTPAILLTASLFISMPLQADYQKESKIPPAGIAVNKAPMFVSIGFDDNGDAEGMNWILNFLRGKKNKDGSPARVTFFNTTTYIDNPGLRNAWKQAYKDGHEIGNHTVNHNNGDAFNYSRWDDEISSAHWALASSIIPEAVSEMGNMTPNPNPKVIGFRAPRLKINNNLFTVLKDENYVYDASIQGRSSTGEDFPWPYTLDHGASGTNLWAHPGIWELGVMPVVKTNGSQVTGLDYNMWHTGLPHKMSESASVDALLNTLKLRMQGNRSPFLFGGHSAFYSSTYDGSMSIDYKARRRVIEKFLTEALKIPEVRIVPYNNVVKWMRNPVALGNSSSGGGGNSSGGENSSSASLDAIAWEINNFQELVDGTYSSGLFKSGQSYGWAAISKNLLNAANSVWGENTQAAMISLYTAEWYVSNTMNNNTARSTALAKISSYLRKIGY